MASVELVQPHDSTWLTPRSRSEMAISLDTMPTIETGMAYGVTFLPRSTKNSWYWRSPTSMPPPPLPITTPAPGSAMPRPASVHASRAATTPMSAAREYRFGSARYSTSQTSSPSIAGTSPIVTPSTGAATRHARSEASNAVIARVALQPAVTHSQNRSRPTPNGETTPMPVITTRGMRNILSGDWV